MLSCLQRTVGTGHRILQEIRPGAGFKTGDFVKRKVGGGYRRATLHLFASLLRQLHSRASIPCPKHIHKNRKLQPDTHTFRYKKDRYVPKQEQKKRRKKNHDFRSRNPVIRIKKKRHGCDQCYGRGEGGFPPFDHFWALFFSLTPPCSLRE